MIDPHGQTCLVERHRIGAQQNQTARATVTLARREPQAQVDALADAGIETVLPGKPVWKR